MKRVGTILFALIMAVGFSGVVDAAKGGKKARLKILDTLTEVDCISSVDLTSEAAEITVGSDTSQCFLYQLDISGAAAGDVFVDSAGAEWDVAEELDLADGNGFTASGDCGVTLSQPASASKPNAPEQQPEHVTIVMTGGSCTVDVYLKTVGMKNSLVAESCSDGVSTDQVTCEGLAGTWTPAYFALFHPGGCDYLTADTNGDGVVDETDLNPLLDDGGVPMVDWFAVNDGAKGYDASDDGELMTARLLSYQLKPLGCDYDGDEVLDVDDDCPLDGDAGSVDGAGCPL